MARGEAAKAGGSMREAAQVALAADWRLEEAAALVGAADVAMAIGQFEAGLVPLGQAEPKLDGEGASLVRQWLRPIGMKIAPAMDEKVAGKWLSAVVMALRDFPAKVTAQAARAAIMIPMAYLNEVDGHVRAEAEKIMGRHRTALRRLRAMQEAIARAAAPERPQIAAPEDGATPLSPAELRVMPPELRRIGLAQGWVTQAALDAADAEREVAA
jgi:hypothetical protein